jgi:uncharacterized membrane protein YebE (DUF533 family)
MFDAKKLLNDVLGQVSQQAGRTLNVPSEGTNRDSMMKGAGGGALVGLVTGLLLGSKGGRRMGGKAVKLGALAAVGTLAYKAYQDYQAKQAAAQKPAGTLAPPPAETKADPLLLLRAMVSAAKADGHISNAERDGILTEVGKLGLGADGERFHVHRLGQFRFKKALAADVPSPEVAVEVYAISALVADEQNPEERAYLSQLAAALGLSPELAREIEENLRAAN